MSARESFLALLLSVGIPLGLIWAANAAYTNGVKYGRNCQKCESAGGKWVQEKCWKQEIKP